MARSLPARSRCNDGNGNTQMADQIRPALGQRFPSAASMEALARKRIPRFAWDYTAGGIGREEGVRRNIGDLQAVLMMPRYMEGAADTPVLETRLFGRPLAAPFGVAPMGLNGLIWPGCEQPIAAAARSHGVVHVLSTHATRSLEDMKLHSGENGWFQLYPPGDPAIESDLIGRARRAGYEVLVVTVDIPGATRRDRDIRNGLSVPPKPGPRTVCDAAIRPRWLLRLARHGIPHFRNLEPYAPRGLSIDALGAFLGTLMAGHITAGRLKRIRDQWPGRLVVKGVLHPDEAAACVACGADAVVVSNHGGRQLDAAPSAAAMLPAMRARLGPDVPVFADGGVRTGLDIARMIALGADYVFLGRPFLHAATLGDDGAAHLMAVLKEELRCTMLQLGCDRIGRLPEFRLPAPAACGTPAPVVNKV